ncbi:cytochrome P450 [Aspergillus aurantiobrunneus]
MEGVSRNPGTSTDLLHAAWLPCFLQVLAACRALDLIIAHVTGVCTSMILYRAFLHRLNAFRGPFLARISSLYATHLSAKRFHLYEETERLHGEYGDYAQLSKGPWYHILHPHVSLHTERDKKVHARRRKASDMGFSSKALRHYEDRVSKYTDQLVKTVDHAVSIGTALNMSKWFNYYSLDVMGDMAFGKSFNMLINGRTRLFARLTWLFPFLKAVPGLNGQYVMFWEFLDAKVKDRIKNEPAVPDIFSWILRDYCQGPKTAQDTLNLNGDSYLIVVAGSDTIPVTLAIIFFYLAMNAELAKQLQDELDKHKELSHRKLGEMDLLEGIINEALRLHPTVGDVYLPGNAIAQSPLYTVFRDHRNFERSLEILPTRWTTEPHLIKNKVDFIPFNSGPYSCAGKQLALMELRSVTAELLKRYNLTLAPGVSNEAYLDGLRDIFILVSPSLTLVFSRRVRAE